MRNKTRIIMTIVIIFTMAIPNFVFADSDISYDDMAAALNNVNILRGDGADYNLSGQLKRSEAVAFLVRLLGVEEKVIEDQDRYINDDYIDVESSHWYSYYIGYVTSGGIVNGFSDGTFKPDKYVTEKEFIKMILGALNYRQGIDYQWNNIYDFSYSIGLYDKSYKNKNNDNKNYTRKGAISLMYNALNMKINKLDKTLAEKLIDKQVFTVDEAIDAGLIKDTIKTNITTVNVLSDISINIVLSEEVKEFDKENIVICEADNDSEELNIEEVIIKKNSITITTDKQNPEKEYKLKILELEDLEGYKTVNLEKIFKGYFDEYVESNYFQISKVKAVSKNVVNVYFTHPINLRALLPRNYTILREKDTVAEGNKDDMGIALLSNVDNGISIFLRDYDLEDGVKYTIDIDGDLSSKYGVDINDGSGEEMSFIGTSFPNKVFGVDNIEILDNQNILITFNNFVDKSSATRKSNYELIDANGHTRRAIGAALVGYGEEELRKVKVRFPSIIKDKEYELTINDIKDSYDQMSIEDTYPLYTYMDYEMETGIDFVYAENQNTLAVYFNQVIPNIQSAKYGIKGISIKTVLYDKDEPDKITIYTNENSPLRNGVDYELKVHNAKDEFGKPYEEMKCTFEGTSEKFDEIDIDDCKFISDEKLYVEFDKNINYSNSIVSKFELEYEQSDRTKKISAKSISYINDRVVIVRFNDVSDTVDYRLNIDSLQDYSKQFTSKDISRSVDR